VANFLFKLSICRARIKAPHKGTAYTFFTPGNLKQARELIKVLEEANQAINPKLMQLVDHRGGGGGGGKGKSWSSPGTAKVSSCAHCAFFFFPQVL